MKKLLNIDYSAMQGTYWMFYCMAGIFVAVYMLGKGYSNTEIGLVIAVGNIASILIQAVTANITDRFEKITNISVLWVFMFILFTLTTGVIIVGAKSLLLTVLYTMLIVIHTTMHPFVNSLSFTLEDCGEHISFGIGRGVGSGAAAFICLAMGYLVTAFGVDVIPAVGLIILLMMLISMVITTRHYKKFRVSADSVDRNEVSASALDARAQSEEIADINMPEFIRRNKLFMIFSIGIVALFFGNVILENFTIQIVEGIGGDTKGMGTIIFFMALLETPAMIFFDKLKARYSYTTLLRTSALFFSIKIFLMYMADSMFLLYIAQINQVLGYGLFFPAIVSFIDYIMDKGEAVRGQAVFTATITIGSVLGSVFGGIILDAGTSKDLLLVCTILSVCGTLIIMLLVNKVIESKKDPADD